MSSSPRVCGSHKLVPPPRSFRLGDPEDNAKRADAPTEMQELGDVDGDGRGDVGLTTEAHRSMQGNEVVALYLQRSECFQYAGLYFGYLVDNAQAKTLGLPVRAGAFFAKATANLHREEQTEYRFVNGTVVGHALRFCRTSCEGEPPRCSAWVPLGDKALPPRLWEVAEPNEDWW